MKKSQIVGLLLTFFFGPLGLFYSSTAAGIAMVIVSIVVGSATFFLGVLFLWPLFMLLSVYTVHRHNRGVRIDERRHEELVKATRPD